MWVVKGRRIASVFHVKAEHCAGRLIMVCAFLHSLELRIRLGNDQNFPLVAPETREQCPIRRSLVQVCVWLNVS